MDRVLNLNEEEMEVWKRFKYDTKAIIKHVLELEKNFEVDDTELRGR
jgi:hypothetical protein